MPCPSCPVCSPRTPSSTAPHPFAGRSLPPVAGISQRHGRSGPHPDSRAPRHTILAVGRFFPATGRALPDHDRVSLAPCREPLVRGRASPAPAQAVLLLDLCPGLVADLAKCPPILDCSPRAHVPVRRMALPATPRRRSTQCLFASMNCRWSYFVPFSFRRFVVRRHRLRSLLPLLQSLVDHAHFEQNPAPLDLFLDRFELRRRYFSRAVRHVQQHALQFVQYACKSRISLLQRGLPVQPVFFQQIFCAALLGRDVHFFLRRIVRGRVRKLHQHSFGVAQVLAHGNHQHALPHLFFVRDVVTRVASLGDSPGDKRRYNQRHNRARRREPPWLHPHLPPPNRFLRQPRRNLRPHPPSVICSGFRHRQRIQRRQHRLDSFELPAALFTSREMLRNHRSLLANPLAKSNQLCFRHVFHDSVPIARACARVSTKGCSVRRNFCTARKTVFFVAFELDFRTSAISSIPQPSQ